jgi:hypothetical protein
MNIHSIFILKSSGIPLYVRNFTDEFKNIDSNIITPFFSAIITFVDKVVNRKLEELEMSGLRFTIKEENNFIFVLLSDSSVSILFTSTCLLSIIDTFFREYYQLDKVREFTQIQNPDFDKTIDAIIKGEKELFGGREFNSKIIDIFKNLIFDSTIIGAGLLSTRGTIIYNSLPDDILLNSIKELEIRFMSGTLTLPEMYYSLESGEKVFCKIISGDVGRLDYFIVLLFSKSTALGMAEVVLLKTTKTIEQLIQKKLELIQ